MSQDRKRAGETPTGQCVCARSFLSLRERSATRVHCPETGRFRFPPLRQDHRINTLPTQNASPSAELFVRFRNHEAAAPPAWGILWRPLQSRHTHQPLARPSHP